MVGHRADTLSRSAIARYAAAISTMAAMMSSLKPTLWCNNNQQHQYVCSPQPCTGAQQSPMLAFMLSTQTTTRQSHPKP